MTGLPEMTPTQERCLAALATLPNGMGSADRIAAAAGYRPARSGRLAVTSALRAIEGNGVCRIPPRDQWSTATWSLTR